MEQIAQINEEQSAWEELCFILQYLRDPRKMSTSEKVLLEFLKNINFSNRFAGLLKAECPVLWAFLLDEAKKQKEGN